MDSRRSVFSASSRGGTKLTLGTCQQIGKPVLHIYHARKERIFNQDSLRLQVHALTDFLRSNKIEVLNVAGPRESKEPGVSRVDSVGWGRGEWGTGNLKLGGQPLF